MSELTVSVIGLGYIGLPTAAMFASRKVNVIGVDIDPEVVATINRGEIHIVEPDLDITVHAAVSEGYLRATRMPEPADAFLIAVPTPFKRDNHDPDLGYIEAAARAIAPVLKVGDLVILESTSPVGTTEQMANWLAAERTDLTFPQSAGEESDIRIAHCPERVLPGKVMQELIHNDRVIGGMTSSCSAAAVKLYKLFVQGECVVTTPSTAEMAKLTENTFRDVNIAFANELSIICDKYQIDVWELINLANRHPRVNILQPGPGVGGHCIAVDPWFIISSRPEEARLIRVSREVNDSKPDWVLSKVAEAIDLCLAGGLGLTRREVKVACYGLTFKRDIDDLRESPALNIVQKLSASHPGPVLIVDPYVKELPSELSDAQIVSLSIAKTAHVHLMLVDHQVFTQESRPCGLIVDTRGAWRSSEA